MNGCNIGVNRFAGRAGAFVLFAAFLGASLGGCATVRQQSYPTPDAAVDAMIASVRPEIDRKRLEEVFGPSIRDGLMSGDPTSDRNDVADFLERYDASHRLVESTDGTMTLEVGDDHWPFAFPIVKQSDAWQFDTEAGIEELQNRRVGANELDTIETCLAIRDAQLEYAMNDEDGDGWREYAQQFRSDPGARNGLYWPVPEGEPMSPLGPLVGEAALQGYARGAGVYHGYRYRMLTGQGRGAAGGAYDYIVDGHMIGGFAVVAWPAEYGESGIMTFITNQDGVVYEKDLGEETELSAQRMRAFDPSGWNPVPPRFETEPN